MPHEGVGGCVPMPRKESAASVRMPKATEKEHCTRSGARQLGRMWRITRRRSEAPSARAAATKSCSLTDSTWARMSRAKFGTNTTPMANSAWMSLGPSTAVMPSARTRPGKDRITSSPRMITLSTRPPR